MLTNTIFTINSVRAQICRASSAVIQEPHLTAKDLIQDVTEARSCSPTSPATTGRSVQDWGEMPRDNFLNFTKVKCLLLEHITFLLLSFIDNNWKSCKAIFVHCCSAASRPILRYLCSPLLQVDIGMKLQACTGSCQSASPLKVDHESYQDSMELLDKGFASRSAAKAPSQQVPRLKLLAAELGLVPSREYKTIPVVQRELLTEFEDIEPNQIILEDSVENDVPCSE